MADLISIEIKDKEVKKALDNLSSRLKDMKPIMQGIGAVVLEDVQEHFRENKGSDKKWDPLSKTTIDARRKGKGKKYSGPQMLRDTGFLRNSLINSKFESVPKSGIRIVDREKVILGTTVEYAAIHNFGGYTGKNNKVKIPQREFMWLSQKANTKIIKMIGDVLEKEWKK